MEPLDVGGGLDLLSPGKCTRVHRLRAMERAGVLFL
jgi:hypothetical protein